MFSTIYFENAQQASATKNALTFVLLCNSIVVVNSEKKSILYTSDNNLVLFCYASAARGNAVSHICLYWKINTFNSHTMLELLYCLYWKWHQFQSRQISRFSPFCPPCSHIKAQSQGVGRRNYFSSESSTPLVSASRYVRIKGQLAMQTELAWPCALRWGEAGFHLGLNWSWAKSGF